MGYLCGVFCLGVFVGNGIVVQQSCLGKSMVAQSGSQSEAGVYRCLCLSLSRCHIQAAIFFECFVGDCSCLCVCLHQIGPFRFFTLRFLFCIVSSLSLLKMYEDNHAAFWSEEEEEENLNSNHVSLCLVCESVNFTMILNLFVFKYICNSILRPFLMAYY